MKSTLACIISNEEVILFHAHINLKKKARNRMGLLTTEKNSIFSNYNILSNRQSGWCCLEEKSKSVSKVLSKNNG